MFERAAWSNSDRTDELLEIGFRCISLYWNVFILFRTGVEVCLLKFFVGQTWNLRTDASVPRNFVMYKLYLPFYLVLFLHVLQRLQDEIYFLSGLMLCMTYISVPYLATGVSAPQIVP